jgi:chromatin remodeling complex protein RSC6
MPARKNSAAKSAPSTPSTPAKSSGKRAKKTTPAPEQEAAPAPAPAPEPVPAVETEASTVSTLSTSEQIEADFQSLQSRLTQFKTLYTSINTDLRALQKTMQRHIKETGKRTRRQRPVDPNKPKRAPSGFAKPALISTELCNFLSVPDGTEMARTEVTKHLTTYIKEHNLQDQANKRRILPDSALQSLLNVGASDELTYFNLQKFMKVHFPKSASALAASALAASATASA